MKIIYKLLNLDHTKIIFNPVLCFLILLNPIHSRPGMGQSYRSSTGTSGSSYNSSSYRSTNNSTSNSPSSSVKSINIESYESYSTTIPDSPILDLKLKILKNGNIEVKESFQLSPDKTYKPISRVSPDVLRGIMTESPQNRPEILLGKLSSDAPTLTYTIEKAFHPVNGQPIGYIFFEEPLGLEKSSILIEQEDGLGNPEINFWLSADGGVNYHGTAPFHFFNSEQRLEIGKLYEFPKKEYRYSMFFYIQYKSDSPRPLTEPLPEPESFVSYKTRIELGKNTYSKISTEIDYQLTESSIDNYGLSTQLPLNIDYKDLYFDNGIYYYLMDRKIQLPIYYSSFHGDWESSFFSNPKNIKVREPGGNAVLSYETSGNFKESENSLDFDFHIPYISFKDHKAYLKSFDIELILPEGADETNTQILLYAARSAHVYDSDPSFMEIPIRLEKVNGAFRLKSEESFVGPARLIVNIEMDKSILQFSSIQQIALLAYSGLKTPFSHNFFNWFLPCLLPLFLIVIPIYVLHRKKKSHSVSIPTSEPRNQNEFEKIAEKISIVLQKSWNSGNLTPARPFLSAGLYGRLSTQLELLENNDQLKNRMDEFSVISVESKGRIVVNDYETIHLKMNFNAKDITVPSNTSEETIQNFLKSSPLVEYSEIYSFTRKLSANTLPGMHLITGNCPSCGSPADYSHYSLKCSSCGNIFNSGEKDWVLSEITQISEWEAPVYKEIFTFSPQILEDRASALFWKLLKSRISGNPKYLSRDASENFLNSLRESNNFFLPVVGAVNLLEISGNEKNSIAQVEIKWSASQVRGSEPIGRTTKLKLFRSTEDEHGFSESLCSNCGAPLPELDSIRCEYCSTSIPTKVRDWHLEKIEPIF